MSDIIVRAQNLTKSYTLYPSPWERLREIVGIPARRNANYPTHIAVNGIDLVISAGERVGFIGRNGAGKSTLLKLITGVIAPTSGSLEITGETHALLQMGAGFHEDLTGRENAKNYLANLGVSEKESNNHIRDIIDFAELEEYIDQPLKTYSTGMQMRLIFAASTAIAPKLFVVDEVLGVGDAYFQQKSFNRIQELCEKNNTTLLLVSHDIYTAAKICNRMIWIDRGRIKFDGEPKAALNLYEASIKEQEEQRLRKKAVMLSTERAQSKDMNDETILIELRPQKEQLTGPIEINKAVVVNLDHEVLAELNEFEKTPKDAIDKLNEIKAEIETIDDGSCWEYQTDSKGNNRAEVKLADYGSIYHKGLIKVSIPRPATDIRIIMNVTSLTPQSIVALIYDQDLRPYLVHELTLQPHQSTEFEIPVSIEGLTEYIPGLAKNVRHGNGGIRVLDVDILDSTKKSTRFLKLGDSVCFQLRYIRRADSIDTNVEAVLTFNRDGIQDVMRVFCPDLKLSDQGGQGLIEMRLDRLPLAPGTYVISGLIAKKGYYASNSGQPFSLNPQVFDVISRAVEFNVSSDQEVFKGTGVAIEGNWRSIADTDLDESK